MEEKGKPSNAVRLLDASVRLDIGKINAKHVIDLHKGLGDSIFAERVLKHLVVHYFRLFHTEVSARQALCEEIGIPIEVARKEALLHIERKRLPRHRG